MFNSNTNTVLSVDENTVLSVYFNPSTRQDAKQEYASGERRNHPQPRERPTGKEFLGK